MGHSMTATIALITAKSRRHNSPRRTRLARDRFIRFRRFRFSLGIAAIVLASAATFLSQPASADESGISFWIPGFFGSLAATPQQPGWSLANVYYHTSVSAGGNVALAREFQIGQVPTNVTATARLNANVNANEDLGFVIPPYVFATPVLGGQASASLVAAYGVVDTTLA